MWVCVHVALLFFYSEQELSNHGDMQPWSSFLDLIWGPSWLAYLSSCLETYKQTNMISKTRICRKHNFPSETFNKVLVGTAGLLFLALAGAVILEEAIGFVLRGKEQ